MSDRNGIPKLDRSAFFSGQPLTAADLTALQENQRQMRWMHHRGMHSWGVGLGFTVTGRKGDRRVTVSPGYAVDLLGREVILAEPVVLPVPAVAALPLAASGFRLVAAYVNDADLPLAERRTGVCQPGGVVRRKEAAWVGWRLPGEIREGEEIVLAEVMVENCRISEPISFSARQVASPPCGPYIASGRWPSPDWENWRAGSSVIGMITRVDTTSARFRSTPIYSAHIEGERWLEVSAGSAARMTVVAFPSVVSSSATGFTLQVLIPAVPGEQANPARLRGAPAEYFNTRPNLWSVVWMGMEA